MPKRKTNISLNPEETWALQDALIDILPHNSVEDIRVNHPEKFENLYRVVEIISENAVNKEISYLHNRKVDESFLPIHPRMWLGVDRWKK